MAKRKRGRFPPEFKAEVVDGGIKTRTRVRLSHRYIIRNSLTQLPSLEFEQQR